MTERQPSSRTCFVCGRDNPVSLKMKWDQDCASGEIRSTVVLPEHFNGYPGVAHGGVIAAVLDETAGRVVLSRVQTEYLISLTQEISENYEALRDGEFMLNEFVDRFGPRLAHLNGLLQVLSQLSATPNPANTPNTP